MGAQKYVWIGVAWAVVAAGGWAFYHSQVTEAVEEDPVQEYRVKPRAGGGGKPATAKIEGATIRGKVLGFPENKPGVQVVAGLEPGKELDSNRFLTLQVKGLSAPVQADGSFELTGLPKDESWDLVCVDSFTFSDPIASNFVKAAAGDEGVNLDFNPGAEVSFQVFPDVGDEPLVKYRVVATKGATRRVVSLTPNGRGRNRRHPEGRGTLYGVRGEAPSDGEIVTRLHIEAGGYYRHTIPIQDWGAGEKVDLGVIRLRPVSHMTFRVIDGKSGLPLEGARVILREEEPYPLPEVSELGILPVFHGGGPAEASDLRQVSARTGPDGTCELVPFWAPKLSLKVSAALRATHWERDFVIPEEDKEFKITLERGVRMSWQALDHDGAPRGESWFVFEGPNAHSETGPLFSDDNGWVVLPKAFPGEYKVRALPYPLPVHGMDLGKPWDAWKGYPGPETVLEVPKGEVFEAEIPLPPLVPVSGKVLWKGKPLAKASVFVAPYGESVEAELLHALMVRERFGYPWLDITDGDGDFFAEAVPAGEMFVQVRLAGPGRSYFTSLTVQEDMASIEIKLPDDWHGTKGNAPELGPGASPVAKGMVQELLISKGEGINGESR